MEEVEQLAAEGGIVDPLEAVDGGAERGEGVLELVRDVGCKGLGAVDPLPEALGHVGERTGEEADLVAAGGEHRHIHLAVAAEADPVGGVGEASQGQGDGAGEEEREEH